MVLRLSEQFYQLSKVKTESIQQLRKRTITAIKVISITYIITLMLLIAILLIFDTSYWFIVLVIPLLVYLWLITYGGIKHVNNHYGFKKTSEGILLYKKQRERYTTYTWVFIIIFYISSIIRLICEIRNLRILNAELSSRLK